MQVTSSCTETNVCTCTFTCEAMSLVTRTRSYSAASGVAKLQLCAMFGPEASAANNQRSLVDEPVLAGIELGSTARQGNLIGVNRYSLPAKRRESRRNILISRHRVSGGTWTGPSHCSLLIYCDRRSTSNFPFIFHLFLPTSFLPFSRSLPSLPPLPLFPFSLGSFHPSSLLSSRQPRRSSSRLVPQFL